MPRFITMSVIFLLVFCFLFLLTFFGLVQQGRSDIQRELSAGQELAELLSQLADDNPQRLALLEDAQMRHLVIKVQHSVTFQDFDGHDEVPVWFYQLIWRESLFDDAVALSLSDGRRMWLMVNPFDEIEEVWESVVLVFLLFIAAYAIAILAAYYGRRIGIKPFQLLLSSLDPQREKPFQFSASLNAYDVPEARQLAACFSQMSDALELEQKSNQRLTEELMALQEKERSYLARELHDDLGQYLTGISAQSYLISQAPENSVLVKQTADRIIEHCQAMQEGFLRLVRSLHPVMLEPLGLSESLQGLVAQWQQSSGIDCRVCLPEALPPLQKDAATHIYRLVQEALNNVARHARANKVLVTMNLTDKGLEVVVDDDGQGLQANMVQGVGLRSMYERARSMNANLQFVSNAGQGLKIILQVPCFQEGVS